ncbi:hypothetical protein KKC22_04645, partial [Myxococcota bacterium]|nr:hypothetical protein [Myxococcota bacterium]
EFWVGNNLFDVCHSDTNQEIQERLDEGLLSILREQSRMTEALAKPISDAFYLGQLITVKPPDSPPVAPGWPSDPVLLVEATESNLPPQTPKTIQNGMQQGGKVHETSAWIAIGLAQKLLTENPVLKVLILTPFKFQAKLLRQLSRSELSRYGKERIRAGTVHVAQGSEADVVIFDMVSPGHGWFKGCFAGSDSHERLACVAFSRAKRQIYVVAPEKEFLEVDLWQRVCPNYKMYTPAWNPPVRSAEAPRVRKARPK